MTARPCSDLRRVGDGEHLGATGQTRQPLTDRIRDGAAFHDGTPFVAGAREAIEAAKRRGSVVIWLDAPDSVLAARIAAGRDRPALLGTDPAAEVAELRSQRQRTYRSLADLRVDTEAFMPEHAVAAILQGLRDRAASR